MIRGFEFTLNRETDVLTVDDQSIDDIDRMVIQDADTPHSLDIDNRMVIAKFSRPVEADVVEEGGERRVVISEK